MILVRENELQHYGVLGMKWGVRRAALKDSNVRRLRREKIEANRASYRATNRMANTYIGKKRRQQATDIAWDKFQKSQKADAAYNKAYNQAKIKAANKLYSKNSKQVNKKIATMSAGETFMKTFIFGSHGTLKYEQARGKGMSRGRSVVSAWLRGTANNMTLGTLGGVEYLQNRRARKK